jgi:hypothetical protein
LLKQIHRNLYLLYLLLNISAVPKLGGMSCGYYDEKRYADLMETINFYERIDLLVKLIFSVALFLILFFVGALWLTLLVFAALAAIKAAKWLFVKVMGYAVKKWWGGLAYKLASELRDDKKIGRHTLQQVRIWIDEICTELKVAKPSELLVYESKQANAFASQDRWMGLLLRNRIGLLTNVFHLLDSQELKAVIAHEIGHHKHYPSAGLVPQLLIPILTDKLNYRCCLEHLSDWYAAKTSGIIPTANALIKLYHRGHLMCEISKGLAYVQEDFKIGLAGIAEFREIADEVIPDRLKPDENLDKYMARIIERYFEKRSSSLKGVGKSHVEKYRRDKSIKTERRVLRSRHKIIDWRIFDNRIKDNTLDEQELESLYLRLKQNPDIRLFFSYIPKYKELEKWLSHPPLRERLIFIMEAVPPAAAPTEQGAG